MCYLLYNFLCYSQSNILSDTIKYESDELQIYFIKQHLDKDSCLIKVNILNKSNDTIFIEPTFVSNITCNKENYLSIIKTGVTNPDFVRPISIILLHPKESFLREKKICNSFHHLVYDFHYFKSLYWLKICKEFDIKEGYSQVYEKGDEYIISSVAYYFLCCSLRLGNYRNTNNEKTVILNCPEVIKDK